MCAMRNHAAHYYEFGPFRLDVNERELRKEGKVLTLTPKAFDTLLILVERRGTLVEREELMGLLWPDSFVEESNISQNVSVLRRALGETNIKRRFIETVPKRGYRFVATVREFRGEPVAPHTEEADVEAINEEESGELSVESGPKTLVGLSPSRPHVSRRLRMIVLLCLASLICITGGIYFWKTKRVKEAQASSVTSINRIRSLAILPLKPLGKESSDEYLGLGMADALIVKLGRFQQLSVLPTSTVLRYVGREYDALAVGHQLGVDAILNGTVQHDGDRFRIMLVMIRVNDGRALWSEKFDERFTDLFALQDSVSERVAEALSLRISEEEKKLLTKHYTENLEAYQSYLMGLYFWSKRTKDGLLKAVESFQQAIKQDQSYAPAYAGLGDSYNLIAYYGYGESPRKETYEQARVAAMKALEIDKALAEAYTTLGMISVFNDDDYSSGEKMYKRAIELNPNYGAVHVRYAWLLMSQGNLEKALQEIKWGQEVDPVSPFANAALGQMYYYQRNFDEAIRFSGKALDLEPDMFIAHYIVTLSYEQKGMFEESLKELKKTRASANNYMETSMTLEILGHIYASVGRTYEARKILDELQKMQKQHGNGFFHLSLAVLYEALGNRARALEYVKNYLETKAVLPVTFRFDPRSEILRADPKYAGLKSALESKPAKSP